MLIRVASVRRCTLLPFLLLSLFLFMVQVLKCHRKVHNDGKRNIEHDYRDLLSIANSTFPDTFWHVRSYSRKKNLLRHVKSKDSSTFSFLSNASVVLVACCRDVEQYLAGFRINVQWIVRLFKSYHIFLGESDSSDATLSLIERWGLSDPFVNIYTFGNLSNIYSSRTQRIAHCRNHLLDAARAKGLISQALFYLVLDVDKTANNVLTAANFLSNFYYSLNDWGGMTASQKESYYDVWALRDPTVNYDCWRVVNSYAEKHRHIAEKIFVTIHQKPIPENHELIEVDSAFGGFGIYQTKYLADCRYVGSHSDNDMDLCEHVLFHDCIRMQGARIFINPAFQNY